MRLRGRGRPDDLGYGPFGGGAAITSPMEWGKLQEYTAYLCREKLVAERCQIDLTPASQRLTTICSQFLLSDAQTRTLDTDMTACFQGQPPPPPESVDGRVCPGAKRALLELDALFPR
jgi:hypothetical protein